VSSIFGIWGQYTETDIETMSLMLGFRSQKPLTHCLTFESGFIAESNPYLMKFASDTDRSSIPAVLDGYIGDSHGEHSLHTLRTLTNPMTITTTRALDSLNGSFSIAAYNESMKQLILIRDHVGSRPLYFTHFGSTFVFASTPKAVLAGSHLVTEINPDAISLFFSLIAVPDPNTIYHGIHALRPGHFLTFTGSTVTVQRYWNPKWCAKDIEAVNEEEAAKTLREALEKSVSDATRHCDPGKTCFFLSGGTDTTAVVGLAAKSGMTPMNTFTIGYSGEGSGYDHYNEFSHARRISELYGTVHHEICIQPADVRRLLPTIIARMDQPSGDAINSFLVSQRVPSDFDTVLTGTGGDEVFIGSHWYLQRELLAERIAKWNRVPVLVRDLLHYLTPIIPNRSARRRLRMMHEVAASFRAQYHHLKFVFKSHDRTKLFTPEFESLLGARSNPDAIVAMYDSDHDRLDDINRYFALLLQNEVTNLQVRDLDSMCHANGLEARSPLLDHRVLDVLMSVPGSLKMKNGTLRYLMFKALEDVIPTETQTRKKMSFIVPMDLWARRDLRDIIDNALSRDSIIRRKIFNPDAIAQIRSDYFETGQERHPFKVWMLAVFELWCRFHIDQPHETPIPDRIEDLFR